MCISAISRSAGKLAIKIFSRRRSSNPKRPLSGLSSNGSWPERVVFCYEAGFSGFRLARRLQSQGIEPVVMSPQSLDERCKRVNTDKRDSRAIASRLDRFLAGNEE